MSEETTRDLSDTRSFEERVFARFDVMETRFLVRFSSIDARLDRVEARLDSLDTRVQALGKRACHSLPIIDSCRASFHARGRPGSMRVFEALFGFLLLRFFVAGALRHTL